MKLKNLSILIIDDAKLINNALKKSLQKRGFKITQAFDLETSKAILEKNNFDYVLLDLILPDGGGEELLPQLSLQKDIRVIVLSADRDKQKREYLFNFSIVVDYITKDRYFADMELAIIQLIEHISVNGKLNMLIVDDSSFMRKQLRSLLVKRGFNVYEAIDGKDALKVMKEHKIDGAIIDLEMPIMDGNKLLAAIKRKKENLLMPVMVISGTSDPEKIAKVIKNGANDFIKKPYVTEELLLKIDKMMNALTQQRVIQTHENKFSMYNKAIDKATIFFKLDKDLNIIFANSTLYNLINNSTEIPHKTPFEDYLTITSKDEIDELKKMMNDGETYQHVYIFNNLDQTIHLRLTFTPLLDENGIEEIVIIGFDVSLLYKTEQDLRIKIDIAVQKNIEQKEMLLQQSRLAQMGEMIGMIAHQWRQPLNNLSLLTQMISLKYDRDKLTKELMFDFKNNSNKHIQEMSKTIDDFRDFFKPEKQKMDFCINDIIVNSLDMLNLPFVKEKLSISFENKTKFYSHGFPNELGQAIINILNNAKDAFISNKIKIKKIKITLENKEGKIIVKIIDNAGGISLAIIDKIFDPYFSTKMDKNGTGLGLYMTKIIIEEHMDGKISVKNSGDGVEFMIVLDEKKA